RAANRSPSVSQPGQLAGLASAYAGIAALQPRPAAAQSGVAFGPGAPPGVECARSVDRANARVGRAGAAPTTEDARPGRRAHRLYFPRARGHARDPAGGVSLGRVRGPERGA